MGLSRKRVRRIDPDVPYEADYTYYGSASHLQSLARSWEVTRDELNEFQWYIRGGRDFMAGGRKALWDIGGPLYTEKFRVELFPAQWSGSWFQGKYSGPLFDLTSSPDGKVDSHQVNYWKRPMPTEESILLSLGSTAISKCKPVNPHASLAQALIELKRDGLPSVPFAGLRRDGLRGLPEDHLNYEFGIKPLLSDIKSVRQSLVNSKEFLAQYARDAGRPVRRKYSFPVSVESNYSLDTTTYRTVVPVGNGSFTTYAYRQPRGKLAQTIRTEKSYRFSGCFSYQALPDTSDKISWLEKKIREANHLLGLAPTPEVFWETLPWSWFIDWFTNVGDVISNASALITDGLVVNWGYLTEVIKVTTSSELAGVVMCDGSAVTPRSRYTYESKRRVRATPYGFGFDMSTLSARQLAILASLGLTRGGRYKAM